jgi:hypothetical protein
MVAGTIDKVIVTHRGALKAKYGAAYAGAIKPAIAALIAADKTRGLRTRLVLLDSAAQMRKFAAPPVTKAGSASQHKKAIDAVWSTFEPAYLCILGAIDVVPHQDLANPLASDGDPIAWSDLPYACSAGYSTRIDRFLQPTRVVGRLPDLTGATDPGYLVGVLSTAAAAQSLAPAAYADYLAISAKVWKASTAQSLQNVFGNASDLEVVPAAKPPWPRIGSRSHFINCHGATADPRFYGQQGSNYPVAHDAAKLAGLAAGTVAGVECCYGAELYDPALANGKAGICNSYLGLGAHGYFGSSTIAYGPASGNGQADLICQFFLKRVLSGSSTGEAALQARLDFLQQLSLVDPTDLKTLAQFSLMGDPSLHPVQGAAGAGDALAVGSASKPVGKGIARPHADAAAVRLATRAQRRRHLATLGRLLGSAMVAVDSATRRAATGAARSLLETELTNAGARRIELCSYSVSLPSGAKAKGAQAAAMPGRVDVAVGELPIDDAPFRRLVVVVARQAGGTTIVRRLYSR